MLHGQSEPNYIAVEGVIGVGKTTFAQMLSERLGAQLVNEEVFENPYLVDFYKNRRKYAFPCQLYFLISRHQQQQQLVTRDLFAQKLVADYLFAKDSIFASVTLNERELGLYGKVADVLAAELPRPDLVIYLQADTTVLMERIRKRGLFFEQPMDDDYIESLNNAYDYFFFHYSEVPLLVVKTNDIDFVANPEQFDDLIDQIHKPLTGKRYYAPTGDLIER